MGLKSHALGIAKMVPLDTHEAMAHLCKNKVSPDRLTRIAFRNPQFKLSLFLGKVDHLFACRVGKSIQSRLSSEIGVVEGYLEYRPLEALIDQEIRGVVIDMALLECATTHAVGLDALHHASELTQQAGHVFEYGSVGRVVEDQVARPNSKRSGYMFGLALADRCVVSPTHVDVRADLSQAFDPGADGDLVVRMGHAEEPSKVRIGIESGHSRPSRRITAVLDRPSSNGRITTLPPYERTMEVSGIESGS